jgi:hypothetical protein
MCDREEENKRYGIEVRMITQLLSELFKAQFASVLLLVENRVSFRGFLLLLTPFPGQIFQENFAIW